MFAVTVYWRGHAKTSLSKSQLLAKRLGPSLCCPRQSFCSSCAACRDRTRHPTCPSDDSAGQTASSAPSRTVSSAFVDQSSAVASTACVVGCHRRFMSRMTTHLPLEQLDSAKPSQTVSVRFFILSMFKFLLRFSVSALSKSWVLYHLPRSHPHLRPGPRVCKEAPKSFGSDTRSLSPASWPSDAGARRLGRQ